MKLDSGQSRGIGTIGLSPDAKYVAVSDMSNEHTIFLGDTEKGKWILKTQGGTETILHMSWSRAENDLRFATVGIKDIRFWHPTDKTRLIKKGIMQGKG
jgi:WD40 repeat protein